VSVGGNGGNGPTSDTVDESPAQVQAVGDGRDQPDEPEMLKPGTRLGGFEVTRMLGRGGMSIVYTGIQLSLNRPVAVKVLHPRFSRNASFIERFDREAGALASLNHPNIVNIIDRGAASGRYFFVMELIQGINLDQLIGAVDLNERQYTHVIAEIAKALGYVHSKGIVHRDIKPSNVLVNKHGLVKVSDFGIAHIAHGDFAPERFGPNATVGTANYMAPEQAEDPAAVDKRADIYALGVTFYKMFTRQLPVGAYRGPSVLNPRLPRSLDAVIAKSMQANPADRFGTVEEFCGALLETFAPAKSEASTVASPGPFVFNPGLFDGTARPVPDDAGDPAESSGGFRSSLYLPGSDSGFGSPTPFPVPPAVQQATAEPDDDDDISEVTPGQKKTMYVVISILVAMTIVLAVGFWVWQYFYLQ
jgi:serine/threonine protein kinase